MGDMLTCYVSPSKHDVLAQFLADFVEKTRILTCILQHLNRKKILRATIPIQNMFYNDKFYREAFARSGESRWSFENDIDQIIYSAFYQNSPPEMFSNDK